MNQYLTVKVVTPADLVYDHQATIVDASTTAAQLRNLPKHEPNIVPLTNDEVRVKRTDSDTKLDWNPVNGGSMEVCDDLFSIVSESCEREGVND
ncbi:F0F1 ATP synthase subunit epsilon, partial [Enterococcus faecium]